MTVTNMCVYSTNNGTLLESIHRQYVNGVEMDTARRVKVFISLTLHASANSY